MRSATDKPRGVRPTLRIQYWRNMLRRDECEGDEAEREETEQKIKVINFFSPSLSGRARAFATTKDARQVCVRDDVVSEGASGSSLPKIFSSIHHLSQQNYMYSRRIEWRCWNQEWKFDK